MYIIDNVAVKCQSNKIYKYTICGCTCRGMSDKLIFWLLLVVGPHSNLEFMKTSVIIALVIVWFQPFTLITNILITGL